MVKRIPNGLIQIDIQPVLTRLEEMDGGRRKELILRELSANPKLRASIFSCLINCALPEYRDMSPFYVACSLGRDGIFSYMKQYEPNVNTCDVTRTLCIHAAIRSQSESIVSDLLSMNANCTAPNKLGETPLMCACSKRLEQTALRLTEVIPHGEGK